MFRSLTNRNFRILWIGESISVLGDQFYFVALPWLVLQVSDSGLALGSVLMAAAIPRAAFMLAGGVATDRFSPRAVMLASNVARFVIVAVMVALVYEHATKLWHLYVLAIAFGFFDAFFYPAYVSIVPTLLELAELPGGNSLLQASGQITTLIGPAVAGLVVSAGGLTTAFAVDAVSYIASIAALLFIGTAVAAAPLPRQPTLFGAIRDGIVYATTHRVIRALLVAFAVMNLLLTGPFAVGAPLLAKLRFGGAASLGFLYSTFGAGGLIGTLAAGADRRERPLGPLLVTIYLVAGLTMIVLGLSFHMWISAAALLVLSVVGGYSNVRLLAYLQRTVEPDKMGRVMSLVMLCAQGLLPLSLVASGAVSQISLTLLFSASGVLLMAITAMLFRAPEFWRVPAAGLAGPK